MIFHQRNVRTFRIYSFFDQHMYNLRIYFYQKYSQWQGRVRFTYHTALSYNSLLRAIIIEKSMSGILKACFQHFVVFYIIISFRNYTWFCRKHIVFEDENLLCSMGITCLSEEERSFFHANNLLFNHRILEQLNWNIKIISGFVESQCWNIPEQSNGNVLMQSTAYKAIHRNVSAAQVCCWILQ